MILGAHVSTAGKIYQALDIGLAGMKRIINHPKLKNIPMILETPKTTQDSDKENLALVRKLGSK